VTKFCRGAYSLSKDGIASNGLKQHHHVREKSSSGGITCIWSLGPPFSVLSLAQLAVFRKPTHPNAFAAVSKNL
jgi:hypothetical protein